MKRMEVLGVRMQLPDNQPVVLLKEEDGSCVVPVWVGAPEASAIAIAHQGITPARPLTHDLLLDIMSTFGRAISHVRITKMEENVFFAELECDDGTVIDSRTSDAIAIALRTKCPILAADQVLEAGGVAMPQEDEEEVNRFREFLDNVSAEDFMGPDTGAAGR